MSRAEPSIHVRAVLEARGPAGALVLSDEQVAALATVRNPPVRVTVGGVTVAARIARMGGENLLGFSKKLRAELGVEIGQRIEAEIVLDAGPRDVVVPDALVAALAGDAGAKAAFDALAPSHRKEFARWVEEAKRDQTRDSRVSQTLAMLREGRTR